jgi:phage portal protein BeeE
MSVRMRVFSEARFMFQNFKKGRPSELFALPALDILEHPWPGGTTGDLLARAIQDVDLAGNFFAVRRRDTIRRLRPDWMSIVLGSDSDADVQAGDIDAEVLGYIYSPGGPNSGRAKVALLADQVAHFAPTPDPLATFRGMSWLQPVITEIEADSAATTHKKKFFDNGATPNMVVKLDPAVTKDQYDAWVKKFEEGHTGVENAYKTLYLGGGADATVVGANFQQIDFKQTQGAGETRIAAAAGVPDAIAGFSEGLQGSTLNTGNFAAARRVFADGTMRPLWRNFAGSMERIVPTPSNARLWYDTRDVAFLREDEKDAAEIQQLDTQSIKALTDAGYLAESVVAAVTSGDLTLLKHSGLFSVQLQPPMPNGPPEMQPNGNGQPVMADS